MSVTLGGSAKATARLSPITAPSWPVTAGTPRQARGKASLGDTTQPSPVALNKWFSGLSFINEHKKSGVRFPPKSFFRLFWEEKGKKVERTTEKKHSTRGRKWSVPRERTRDLKKHDRTEEKPGADQGLDQPQRMLSVGGRIEPKGTSFVRL